jgi:phosphatidylserine/phosphatidylglycerophosphate/cardiolipin synthase-like enzyme
MFYGVICTLEHDSLSGCVSPSLIGSTGVISLTIISTIPDIMRHYYDVIVRARKEILLCTMYWEKSECANIIGKAFRDLSKRAGAENRHIIIKLMMDRPKITNAIHYHSIIPPSKWSCYDIPTQEEIPNISLEVHNYHRGILGTFHAKFLIVDRKVVLLNSNNIQDRPNLEMMSHYEGDIVNSFYDTFIISWWLPFQPNLLCLNDNPSTKQNFDSSSNVLVQTTNHAAGTTMDYDVSLPSQSPLTKHLNKASKSACSAIADKNISAEEIEALSLEFSPFLFHRAHEPFPIALVNRSPFGVPGYRDTTNPQDAAWMSAFRYAQKSIFIQSPTFNAPPAIDGIVAACRRGIKVTLWLNWGFNDLKEGYGTFQGGTNQRVVKKLYKELTKTNDGVERNLETFWYTAKGQLNQKLLFAFLQISNFV